MYITFTAEAPLHMQCERVTCLLKLDHLHRTTVDVDFALSITHLSLGVGSHAFMPPPSTPPARWRWVTSAWSVVAIVLTFVIYRCFQEDQAQSGTYGCEMSYMWPTYHPVDWPDNPSNKYSLWLYREQGWDRDLRVNHTHIGGRRQKLIR